MDILKTLFGFDPGQHKVRTEIVAGVTHLNGVVSAPPSVAPIFMKMEWSSVFTPDMFIVIFTFLFVDLFDTIGTVIGVSMKTGMVDKDGKVDGVGRIQYQRRHHAGHHRLCADERMRRQERHTKDQSHHLGAIRPFCAAICAEELVMDSEK